MIKIKIIKDNHQFKQIIISGHANYADHGNDIVCAAVSSIATTTVNGVLSINNTISYEEKDGHLQIDVNKNDEITKVLLSNMINLLRDLEQQYPKNIKIID